MTARQQEGGSPDESVPILYVKTYCPWCAKAESELDRLGVRYRKVDVLDDAKAMKEMMRVSGQSYAPTMIINNQVLADFGPEEVEPFLREIGLLAA